MYCSPFKIAAACCCALMLAAGSIRAAGANEQNTVNTQGAYQSPIAPAARLQVSGSSNSLSLDAERADVQSTLKAILKQSGKQFVPDATVTGQVTLLLIDQPLDTVLRSVCDSCYLQYTKSPAGIYRFTRDDEAVRKAFRNLKQLSTELRAQLRALGLDVPSDEKFGALRLRTEAAAGAVPGSLGATPRDSTKSERPAERSLQYRAAGPVPQANDAPANSVAAKPSGAAGALKRDTQNRIANIHADFIPQGELSQFLGQVGRTPNLQEYDLFVRQNGFVWFNIPEEKPQPVASVLQLFSQQSNVPILVDQSIPSSLKFRVWGNLSPRQLPEALNVLAPTAHLQWRWIGSSVFVVPAPNFLVYFGDQGPGRNSYPAPQRGENNPAADSKERRSGSQ